MPLDDQKITMSGLWKKSSCNVETLTMERLDAQLVSLHSCGSSNRDSWFVSYRYPLSNFRSHDSICWSTAWLQIENLIVWTKVWKQPLSNSRQQAAGNEWNRREKLQLVGDCLIACGTNRYRLSTPAVIPDDLFMKETEDKDQREEVVRDYGKCSNIPSITR